MRAIASAALLLCIFTIPWAYSADFGAPLGNVARLATILVLLAIVPAAVQRGGVHSPGPVQVCGICLLAWLLITSCWSTDSAAALVSVRGFVQIMLPLWLVWELVETPADVRNALRAYVGGAWVLVLLTLANFVSAHASGQVRFAAEGQDPNDVARLLDYAFPLAALVMEQERRWWAKALALGYLPAGMAGVFLTASREGLLAAMAALAGCGFMLASRSRRTLVVAMACVPVFAGALWALIPGTTLGRVANIPEQIVHGDLNARLNIWAAGWEAFARAPFFGSGAGSFVNSAGLAQGDTAHNTALSLAVEGGVVALMFGGALCIAAGSSLLRIRRGPLRNALAAAFAVCAISSLVATVERNRATWFVLSIVSVAARLTRTQPEAMSGVFSTCRSPRFEVRRGDLPETWPAN